MSDEPKEKIKKERFLTPKQKKTIVKTINKKLKEKSKKLKCPICGETIFGLIDGFLFITLQKDDKIKIGGRGVPQIAIICSHCGYIANFSLGGLGLMDLWRETKCP